MTESFRFRGRTYLLAAVLLIFGALVFALFAIDRTRIGPMTPGEVVCGSLCTLLLAIVLSVVWQTCTVTVDEHSVAKVAFGRKLQELRWDAVGEIRFLVLSAPGVKTHRIVAIRPKIGRLGIGLSESFCGFEYFASLSETIAKRRKIKVQRSDAYLRATSA